MKYKAVVVYLGIYLILFCLFKIYIGKVQAESTIFVLKYVYFNLKKKK